jgi:hypothetical protein
MLELRTLSVEGDDLPGRFYRLREGYGQRPGTTACVHYPHAGGVPSRSANSSEPAKASTSGLSKRKVSGGGVGMGRRRCRRSPAMARPITSINAYGSILLALADPLTVAYIFRYQVWR